MLKQLEKNQEELKKDYTKKIDKLEGKLDKVLEKLDNLPSQYITRVEFENCREKVKAMEDNWKKILRIVITAVLGAILSMVLIHN